MALGDHRGLGSHAAVPMGLSSVGDDRRTQVAIDTVVTEMAAYHALMQTCLPMKIGAGDLMRWMRLLKTARGESE